MKKLTIQFVILFCATTLFAQWTPVNNGLDDYPVTTLWPLGEDMALGTDGGGLYQTTDNGDTWVDINGNLENLNINDIRGFNSYTSLFVATEGGPFFTSDLVDYTDCTSSGLTNMDVNYFWYGSDDIGGDFMIGTNGGGVFGSDEYSGPWTAANTNLTGDGFIINDMGGYSEDEQSYAVMATDGGTYWSINGASEWSAINDGLTGDALKVKKIAGLAFLVLIATHDGLYYNYDLADTWEEIVPDTKFNTVFIHPSSLSNSGFMCFAFSENGYYSEDFLTWSPLVMTGVTGEITAAHANSTHVFIGVTTDEKDGKTSGGGVYMAPLNQLLVNVEVNDQNNKLDELYQNYPNPCNGSTTIQYVLTSSELVCITVYDIHGKEIQTVMNEKQTAGKHSIRFNTNNIANGFYYYNLQVGGELIDTKKMLIQN